MADDTEEQQPNEPTENLRLTPESPAPESPWEKFKGAMIAATVEGINNYLRKVGNPFNPFPQFSSNPDIRQQALRAYRGTGAMGERLRVMENPESAPMKVMRSVAEQNPLLREGTVKVSTPEEGLPPGVAGRISWADREHPEISLAPIVNPANDPGVTLLHELAGHGMHGPPPTAENRDAWERDVLKPAEGLATGVERLYGPSLPRSAYDYKFGAEPHYQRAHAIGRLVGKHIADTGHVPPWDWVHQVVFGQPATQNTPEAQGSQNEVAGSVDENPQALPPEEPKEAIEDIRNRQKTERIYNPFNPYILQERE